jgi:hypothetical protein
MMAKEVAADARRGEKSDPPLNRRELAFYEAVADHGTARSLMGDEVLARIARELVTEVSRRLKPDWTARESVRARLRSTIKAEQTSAHVRALPRDSQRQGSRHLGRRLRALVRMTTRRTRRTDTASRSAMASKSWSRAVVPGKDGRHDR